MGKRARRGRRPVIQVNLRELDGIVDAAVERPITTEDAGKLKTALHAMAQMLPPEPQTSEKLAGLFPSEDGTGETGETEPKPKKRGHGRNGADAYTGATRVPVKNPDVTAGTPCPECPKGKLYPLKDLRSVIRVIGAMPIQALHYQGERHRCNCCGFIVDAPMPEGIGEEKYDESVVSAIAQLKYGGGFPFYRLEKMQSLLGVPLPASTQWELVEQGGALLKPAHYELMRLAAQGEVLGNDDTRAQILELKRPDGDKRTGTFTTGIVSQFQGLQIALFITGTQHAGENTGDLLKLRPEGLEPPILMSDALSRNFPKGVQEGVDLLWANCITHGRRHFVDVMPNFPEECRYVLGALGRVYSADREAQEQGLSPEQRLELHQAKSEPVMAELHAWMTEQLDNKLVEENSGLGKALKYMLNHWERLTLFLRKAGAPLDNNRVERALKKVVLHRKNSYFFLTMNGAQLGDLYMSLIKTCELNGANPFHYLTELQRHAMELAEAPGDWMPWNYLATLARGSPSEEPGPSD